MKKKRKFTQTRGGITIKRENTSQRGKKKKTAIWSIEVKVETKKRHKNRKKQNKWNEFFQTPE